ncbi:MAG: tripartite tricarboxylate transporter substrate-binding protein, partial [Sulfuricaulis sp.]|nr:tripartite tricarboxylate transporter substrate-binding protein [Sulfuricaulis sp.]
MLHTVRLAPIIRRAFLQTGAPALAIALSGVMSAGAALAAAYPERTVSIIVPFQPGGGTDVLARILTKPLTESLGKSVIIDNRSGAGGNIGIVAAARAKPDGYTLLMTSSVLVVNPSLYKQATFDPVKDFAPVVDVGASPNVI